MASEMDDALRLTADAVERYRVNERMVMYTTASLWALLDDQRQGAEVDGLIHAILEIATAHDGSHDGECATCDAICNGVAVAMGVVRAETDLELRRMYESGQ
ncbi:hypothetical protein ACWKSP_22175 [Micromonosporaceae bacterium Da 78-11]